MRQSNLHLTPADAVPPPDRGPLLSAADVAADPELFNGKVKARYVRNNVRPHVRLGRSQVFFYRDDVKAWIEGHRQEGAA